jgi:hypothetical protein
MTLAAKKEMISMDEARIMLLKQKNDFFHETLFRLESKMDAFDTGLVSKMDSQFRWTLGFILGLYATAFALIGAVGKAYHWF